MSAGARWGPGAGGQGGGDAARRRAVVEAVVEEERRVRARLHRQIELGKARLAAAALDGVQVDKEGEVPIALDPVVLRRAAVCRHVMHGNAPQRVTLF